MAEEVSLAFQYVDWKRKVTDCQLVTTWGVRDWSGKSTLEVLGWREKPTTGDSQEKEMSEVWQRL